MATGSTQFDHVRELTRELVESLQNIREGNWRADKVGADGRTAYSAADAVRIAGDLLAASEHLDRSRWPLEDLVTRDHLHMLVEELEAT